MGRCDYGLMSANEENTSCSPNGRIFIYFSAHFWIGFRLEAPNYASCFVFGFGEKLAISPHYMSCLKEVFMDVLYQLEDISS